MTHPTIGFIGAGNMASSLIGGLLNKGYPCSSIFACDPSQEQLDRLRNSIADGRNIGLYNSSEHIGLADIVIFAVKPQIMQPVCLDLAAKLKPDCLVISIAAGISMQSLQSWLGDFAVVRCMPNTPALIQKGASGLYANAKVSEQQRTSAENIFNAVGIAHWVKREDLLNAVTAVSGSGPAYFFLFTELMTEVGVEMGLAPDVAQKLSVQTCLGAGQLASDSEDSLDLLREKVTSPGGTTQAAIKRFQSDDLKSIIRNAMQDCSNRAEEMANEFGD